MRKTSCLKYDSGETAKRREKIHTLAQSAVKNHLSQLHMEQKNENHNRKIGEKNEQKRKSGRNASV